MKQIEVWFVVHNLWSRFHKILTILSHFSQLRFFSPPGMAWHSVGILCWELLSLIISVRLPSFWVDTHLSSRLWHMHLINFPCPHPDASRGGEMGLDGSESLLGTCSQAWERAGDSVWTEKLQTDVLFSHLATGRHSCSWPPTLFAPVGEGITSFMCWWLCHILKDT